MADVTGSTLLFPSYLLDSFKGGVFEPENNTIKMGLTGDAYVPSAAHNELVDITDELVSNGYSRQTLTNVSVVQVGEWVKLTFDQAAFAASGGNLAAKYWFMFDDTPAQSPLMAVGRINILSPSSILIIDGFSLTVVVNELGLYRLPVWID